jgi:BirA family transcriptional regulator, biotin operon repressor / biotin---[acetyl-CoA-carboxylase] ligase
MEPIVDKLRTQLNTHFVGRNLIYLPQVTSTNDVALEAAASGAPEGTVVLAGCQTTGRGRLKRAWLSPRGNIAFSLVLHPPLKRLPYMIMVASLGVANAIESTIRAPAGIKWPNDVFIRGKKVCGILIENQIRDRSVRSVIGIGINVRMDMAALPEIAATATSLEGEAGRPISETDLLAAIFYEIERLYLVLNVLPDTVFQAWRKRLVMLGKPVRVISGVVITTGIAEDVNLDGSLCLRLPDGSLEVIVSGDVSLRAA